jgi:membrane protease YdiL (CAAX protease family)
MSHNDSDPHSPPPGGDPRGIPPSANTGSEPSQRIPPRPPPPPPPVRAGMGSPSGDARTGAPSGSSGVPTSGSPSTFSPPVVQADGRGGDGQGQRAGQQGGLPGVRVVVSWILILSLAVGFVLLSSVRHPDAQGASAVPTRVSPLYEMMGRALYHLGHWAESVGQTAQLKESMIENAEVPPDAPWIDRVARAVLVADIDSPAAGIEALDALGLPSEATDADETLMATVRDAMQQWRDDAPRAALPAPEAERLGWFANILENDVPPSSIVLVLLFVLIWYVGVGLIGIALLITVFVLGLLGKLTSKVQISGRGAIYAETFAVWFLLFLGLQMGIAVVLELAGLQQLMMIAALVAMFGSLLALAWPVLRGVPWRDVCSDIGLHTGRGVVVESLYGPVVYAMGLPLMIVGLIIYAILRKLTEEPSQASHPVVEQFGGGIETVVPIFLLACVAAPIVEEIAFRGILYRHLRESGRWIGTFASVLVATFVSSVLFAGIHPQGLLFIPALGGLATAFCIGRETRGTLLPCMIAHAINNAVTVTLGVSLAHG